MTTDEKAFHIAAWRYDIPKEDLIGYPVEPEMYYCIEFMWSIAKKVVREIAGIAARETPSYQISELPGTTDKIRKALSVLDEEALLDALYEAIVKLQEYEQNQPKEGR